MAEAAGLVVLELSLAAALQAVVSRPGLSEDAKAVECRAVILEALKDANDKKKRLFFAPALRRAHLEQLCHSVAVEELHDCYFKRCDLQRKSGVGQRGALFAVYGDKGMGKTFGCLSLLCMRHGRAPRQGYYFSGSSIYTSGDDYYNSLLDTCLGRGKRPPLSRYKDIFDPESVAHWIVASLPDWNPKGDEEAGRPIERRGILDIPGVKRYFDSQERLPGGSPVLVFDDVNIHLTLEGTEDSLKSEEAMQRVLMEKMGKSGTFFAAVMTMAYQSGVLVFVSTSNLLVAKFLHGLNAGKALAFKPVVDTENFTCQEFGWTEQKRIEFLRLRAEQNELDVDDETLQALAKDAFERRENIREMDHGLFYAFQTAPQGVLEETVDDAGVFCNGCTIS